MDLRVLGPLEVRDDAGREVRVPAGRERMLLALLLLERGRVVSMDRILDVLWDGAPPGTAAKAVQGYVSHLRRLLGEGLLATRAPGYALLAAGDDVDAARFERLAAEGRGLLEDGAPGRAADALDGALALWRGPPLADFAFDDFAQDEIRRLEELRLSSTEDRIEALMAAGRPGGPAGELEALVQANPLRERLRALAMLALYRGGRQADALELYDRGRRLLRDELGVEPGPELVRAHRAILAQDPALDPPAPAPRPAQAPGRARPRRRAWAVAGLLALAVVAAVVGLAVSRDGGGSAVAVVPPALVAIDPASNRAVASIAVGSAPVSVAAAGDAVWVGDARDGTVTRIDAADRRVAQTVGIGAPAIDLAVRDDEVWAATGSFGAVVRIDPQLGAATRRVDLAAPGATVVPPASSVGIAGGAVWAGARGGLVRIDPAAGRIEARVDLDGAPALGIAGGEDALWATTIRRRATRVEAGSAAVTAAFNAGVFVVPLALDGAAVWVADADDGQLWKLDAATGAQVLTARAGAGSQGIAVGEGSLWVASWRDGTLQRLDPATGDVRATVRLGGEPQEVAVAGGLVWVAVREEGTTP